MHSLVMAKQRVSIAVVKKRPLDTFVGTHNACIDNFLVENIDYFDHHPHHPPPLEEM